MSKDKKNFETAIDISYWLLHRYLLELMSICLSLVGEANTASITRVGLSDLQTHSFTIVDGLTRDDHSRYAAQQFSEVWFL